MTIFVCACLFSCLGGLCNGISEINIILATRSAVFVRLYELVELTLASNNECRHTFFVGHFKCTYINNSVQ